MQHEQSFPRQANRARALFALAIITGLVAIALRWYFVTAALVFQPLDDPNSRIDATEYYRFAWNLYHHGIFSVDLPGKAAPVASSFRDPGYPLFLAFWMAVTSNYHDWYASVLVAQAVLGGISATCIVLAVRRELPIWGVVSVALLTAAWPHSVSIASCMLSENLTAPLVAVALLAMKRAIVSPTTTQWLIAGMILACMGLTSAVLTPLVVVIATVLYWKCDIRGKQLSIFFLAAVLPLTIWSVRNATLPPGMTATFRAKMNLVEGSWPTYHTAARLWAVNDPVGIQTINAMEVETRVIGANITRGLGLMTDRMAPHAATYAAWYLSKPAILWGWDIGIGQGDIYVYPTHNSPFVTNAAMKGLEGLTFILNPLIALLALAGCLFAIAGRASPPTLALAAATLLWITFVYGVLQSDPRYAIPFRGAEVALAMFALASLPTYVRLRRTDRK